MPTTSKPASTSQVKLERAKLLRIIDGDTVEVSTGGGLFATTRFYKIRLWGMDAPESDQKGGKEATKHLQKLMGRKDRIRVRFMSVDQYGREVAILYPDKSNPSVESAYNYRMVLDGHAVAYLGSGPEARMYREAQKEAEAEVRGIWKQRKGREEPTDFRKRQKARQASWRRIKWLTIAAFTILIVALIMRATGATPW